MLQNYAHPFLFPALRNQPQEPAAGLVLRFQGSLLFKDINCVPRKKGFKCCCQGFSIPPNNESKTERNNHNNNFPETNSTPRRDNSKSTSNGGGIYGSKLEDEGYLATFFHSHFYKQINAFYRFSRPHTILGTIIGISSVSLLALDSFAELSPTFFFGVLKALVPSLAMNIYVVGLNQLYDVEIDKINKPNLPLASGEISSTSGMLIVSAFLLMSFAMGIMFQSPPLSCALLISFLFGSAYSVELPFLRWKRNAFLAAACILIVRAIVVQFAFFLHIRRYVLGKPILCTRSLLFAVAFMCLHVSVIALFKDIPDVSGDRDFGIQSLSVRFGQKNVFWLCIGLLLVAYGIAVLVGASSSSLSNKIVTVGCHGSLAIFLWAQARSVDLASNDSVTSFYMFIWKLFYIEYLLIPFVR